MDHIGQRSMMYNEEMGGKNATFPTPLELVVPFIAIPYLIYWEWGRCRGRGKQKRGRDKMCACTCPNEFYIFITEITLQLLL
jgi:hypothetical protein